MKNLIRLAVLTALLASLAPTRGAWAGLDTEIDASGAYNYDGVYCTSTGAHAGRTVPRCLGTGDGSFYLRAFTRVLGSAPTVTAASIRFVNVTEPDATAAADFVVQCTAFPPNANAHAAVTFGATATIAKDLDADPNCADIDDECQTGSSSAVAIWNRNTGADCASTTCNNSELVCKITYKGTDTDVDDTVDISSIKLTLLP